MTDAAELALVIGIGAMVAVIGLGVAWLISRRLGWAAAGPLALIAATPLVPNYAIAAGLSLDDILPVIGLLMLVPLVPWRAVRWRSSSLRAGTSIAFVGIVVIILTGVISAVVNADDLVGLARLGLRGSGRALFLLLITVSVAAVMTGPDRRVFAARAMALVGTFEAVFGLIAYVLPLPYRAGLEETLETTVLSGQVPGRIAGTIGNSPNFMGAIFIMTILMTAGLALRSADRREQVAWWTAVIIQLAALTLTYTRVSLGLTVVALTVLILMRSRPVLLIPIGVLLVGVAAFTPMLTRVFTDAQNRFALWASAYLLMIDHLVAGVGPGEMLNAVAAHPDRYRFTPLGSSWSTAHNTVLLAGAEMGALGAIGAILLNLGLAILAITTILRAPRGAAGSLQAAAALALGAFLVQGMVNNLFTVGVTGVLAAFLLGSQLLERWPDQVAGSSATVGANGDADSARGGRPPQESSVPIGQDRGGV